MTKVAAIKKSIAHFLRGVGLPSDQEVVVIAGAALWLRGLRDEFNDIDLIVPGMNPYSGYFHSHEGIMIDAGGGLELGGEDATYLALHNAEYIHGLAVMHICDLIRMKRYLNRDCDDEDIRRLEIALEESGDSE
jgi:hypothetical protein